MTFLYNISEISLLLENFHTLLDVNICVCDNQLHDILSYPLLPRNTWFDTKEIQREANRLKGSNKEQNSFIYHETPQKMSVLIPIRVHGTPYGFVLVNQERHEGITEQPVALSHEQWESACSLLQNSITSFLVLKQINREKEPLAQQIEYFITNNMIESLSIPFLCEKFSLSKSTLCQIAKVHYGVGIAKYIKFIRMQKTKELLLDTNLQIHEIAYQVGIDDYNYFTKMFKSIMGTTPLHYRKADTIH